MTRRPLPKGYAYPAHRIDELLPWNWTPEAPAISAWAIVHVNKVHSVTTINRVAEDLGESVDWLHCYGFIAEPERLPAIN